VHLTELRGDCASLALIEEDNGSPVGIVPMRKSPVPLKFEAGDYHFTQVSFSATGLLGATLLAPQSPDVFELLFLQVARSFPDCEAMEESGLSTTSALRDFPRNGQSLRRDFAILRSLRSSQFSTQHKFEDPSTNISKRLGVRNSTSETADRTPGSIRQCESGMQRIDRVYARTILGDGHAGPRPGHLRKRSAQALLSARQDDSPIFQLGPSCRP
jgi:hypothetical protein